MFVTRPEQHVKWKPIKSEPTTAENLNDVVSSDYDTEEFPSIDDVNTLLLIFVVIRCHKIVDNILKHSSCI